VIDLGHPPAPITLGRQETSARAYGVAVSGDYAYLAADSDGLQVINVSNPAQPQWVGGYTNGFARNVAVSGHYAYLANGDLEVIDISNPVNPQGVGKYDADGYLGAVAVSNNLAYVTISNGTNLLSVLDVSDPTHPQKVGGTDLDNSLDHAAYDIAVAGGYAYVAAGRDGLQIFDVSNPTNPQWAASIGSPGYDANDVAMMGHYACVANLGGLDVVDVENPANPKLVSRPFTYETGGRANGVDVVGHYAFVAGSGIMGGGGKGVEVFDLSDPAYPRRVSGNSSVVVAMDIAVAKDRVFVATISDQFFSPSKSGLTILDIVPFFKSMKPTSGQLDLSWENYGNAVLQRTANLGAPDWQLVPGSATTNRMTVPISSPGAEFFRLIKP